MSVNSYAPVQPGKQMWPMFAMSPVAVVVLYRIASS
jgi:hypothetical protein